MKKYIITLLLGVLVLQCKPNKEKETESNVNPPNTFTLNAEIEGITKEFLVYWEKNEKYPEGIRKDTLWMKDGKFTFTDSITNYKRYFLALTDTRSWNYEYNGKTYTASTKADVNRLWFIGYPGATINCKGKVIGHRVDAQLKDDKGINNDLSKINSQVFPLLDKAHELSVRLSAENWEDKDIEAKIISDSVNALRDKALEYKKVFIKSNPKSIAASYVFSDAYSRKYFDHDEAKEYFGSFDSVALSGTPYYEEVRSRITAVENTKIGMLAPELKTNNTLDDSEFKLSSLRGNYVLLDYWGTWCGPCMGEMPKIKEYNNKYSDKNFVVVGVNSGDTKLKWKNAIKNNSFNWTHVQTTKDNNLLIPFNVTEFPTKIVLDPKGKIIYSSKNPDKVDMYALLDKIFSKP